MIPIEALREDQKGFFCLAVQNLQKTKYWGRIEGGARGCHGAGKGDAKAAVSGAIGPDTADRLLQQGRPQATGFGW